MRRSIALNGIALFSAALIIAGCKKTPPVAATAATMTQPDIVALDGADEWRVSDASKKFANSFIKADIVVDFLISKQESDYYTIAGHPVGATPKLSLFFTFKWEEGRNLQDIKEGAKVALRGFVSSIKRDENGDVNIHINDAVR